jgi:2Fe-2S ferredoxin
MENRNRDIVLKIIEETGEDEISTYTGEYRNLMMLLNDQRLLEGFGECGGMGRCATCLIEVVKTTLPLPQKQRNENSTIIKAGITNPAIRLSCQLMVNKLLDGIAIKIEQAQEPC